MWHIRVTSVPDWQQTVHCREPEVIKVDLEFELSRVDVPENNTVCHNRTDHPVVWGERGYGTSSLVCSVAWTRVVLDVSGNLVQIGQVASRREPVLMGPEGDTSAIERMSKRKVKVQ